MMIHTLFIKRMIKPGDLKVGDFIPVTNEKRTPNESKPLETIERLLTEVTEIKKGDSSTRFEDDYRITVVFKIEGEYWRFYIACKNDEYIEVITQISR